MSILSKHGGVWSEKTANHNFQADKKSLSEGTTDREHDAVSLDAGRRLFLRQVGAAKKETRNNG